MPDLDGWYWEHMSNTVGENEEGITITIAFRSVWMTELVDPVTNKLCNPKIYRTKTKAFRSKKANKIFETEEYKQDFEDLKKRINDFVDSMPK